MNQIAYTFEELPLVIENGFSAGLVNGTAEINFGANAEWFIGAICLDGHRRKPTGEWITDMLRTKQAGPAFEEKPVELEQPSWLYTAIFGRLDEAGTWRDHIQGIVNERLENEGAPSIDPNNEHRTYSMGVA